MEDGKVGRLLDTMKLSGKSVSRIFMFQCSIWPILTETDKSMFAKLGS